MSDYTQDFEKKNSKKNNRFATVLVEVRMFWAGKHYIMTTLSKIFRSKGG
jgi:hypothetical protein